MGSKLNLSSNKSQNIGRTCSGPGPAEEIVTLLIVFEVCLRHSTKILQQIEMIDPRLCDLGRIAMQIVTSFFSQLIAFS